MKPLFYLFIFIFLFACNYREKDTSPVPQQFLAAGDPSASGFDAERLKRIDSLMAGYVRDGVMPNAVSFVAKNGKIVHFSAYGFRDAEKKIPVQKDDIFRNASQTKAITAAVLMTLLEENKLRLDDRIEKYLPAFANPRVYVSGSIAGNDLVTRPAKSSITIRHLLSHTSGYSYETFGENVRGINYPEPITTKEAIERIARIPLQHDPGEKFTYGYGLDIAGYLAEVVSGKSLDVLMKERIFDPLGMNDTYFYLPAEKHERLVKCYQRTSDSTRYTLNPSEIDQIYPLADNQPYHGGGAGLSGTIEDYAKFCQMLLNGGEFNNHRVLGRKTVELMGTNQLVNIPGTYQFGLAYEVTTKEGFNRTMISPGSWKWGGAYGTAYVIDPKENMVALIYSNILPWVNPEVHDRFFTSVYQSLK